MLTYYDRNFEAVFVATPSEARTENAAANRANHEENYDMQLGRNWCNTWSRGEQPSIGTADRSGITPRPIDRTTMCDINTYHIQR